LTRNEGFSIQGLVRGPFVKVGKLEEDTVSAGQSAYRGALVLLLTIAAVMVVSIFFNAPLEQPVNVMHPPTGPRRRGISLGCRNR